MLLYHAVAKSDNIRIFGIGFSPVTSLARSTNLPIKADMIVSCYTLFKGWLPLSQPPICLRLTTTLSTLNPNLGTLDYDQGSCPLDHEA